MATSFELSASARVVSGAVTISVAFSETISVSCADQPDGAEIRTFSTPLISTSNRLVSFDEKFCTPAGATMRQ